MHVFAVFAQLLPTTYTFLLTFLQLWKYCVGDGQELDGVLFSGWSSPLYNMCNDCFHIINLLILIFILYIINIDSVF